MTRSVRSTFLLLPLVALALVAAAPTPTDTPDELVRRANDALRAGDTETADKLYTAAEERTRDPGLVAFNRAGVLFERKQYREAEQHYDRVLNDAACPPERAARAWYNRGTCLLNRGGTLDVYRAAVACFENALDSPGADQEVKDRAPHNLELAKLLWMEKAKQEKAEQPPSPNNKVPEEENRQPQRPEPDKQPGGPDENNGGDPRDSGSAPKNGSQPQQVPVPKEGPTPKQAEQNVAGNNANLPVLKDEDAVQDYSPEDARKLLELNRQRRKRELQALLKTLYGDDRPGVKDW